MGLGGGWCDAGALDGGGAGLEGGGAGLEGGGVGLVGGGGFGGATSTRAGSRGSKPLDSAIAASRSSTAELVKRWLGDTCRQPRISSWKQPSLGFTGSTGYFPFSIASLFPAKFRD